MTGWRKGFLFITILCCSEFALVVQSRAQPAQQARIPFTISIDESGRSGTASIDPIMSFPGQRSFPVFPPQESSWMDLADLSFNVWWPPGAPTNAQVLVYVKDADFFWYQCLVPGCLAAGRDNHLRVDMSPTASGWTASGHHGAWHLLALAKPRQVAIRIFSQTPFLGTCRIDKISGTSRADSGAPAIKNVQANRTEVPVYQKFELTFNLPDRYPDPFDSNQILVYADVDDPAGGTNRIEGFYCEDFYRDITATGEIVTPQGRPFWRIRYAPSLTGRHRYTITARDRFGTNTWGHGMFEATPPSTHGFVRVSKKNFHYFEHDDGAYFFPLGHNTRSPFDTRMDGQFPWVQRWDEGGSVYERYFKRMHENGENICEIWSAAWSLGLEWTPIMPGYRGVGRYNMINAWQLDQLLPLAEQNDMHINLVILNHGKFGTYLDPEWEMNPYNVVNGGYLQSPDDFFSNRRAMADFLKLMRYMVARYGYSPRIFAWELWSELDLTGSGHGKYLRPAITDWHREAGRVIKEMDPYDHMVATHVSGDYTRQNKDVSALPEIDFSAVDAYHYTSDPLQIVSLMKSTVDFNAQFKKPVLVTEFGGSHMAQGIKHLDETLHAGLWSSLAMELGGAPMLWWWQVIDEEDFYPKFEAVSRFMAGEDKRDRTLAWCSPDITPPEGSLAKLSAQCLKNKTSALGWIYRSADFSRAKPAGGAQITNAVLRLTDMAEGSFNVEYWDTVAGKPLTTNVVTTSGGTLACQVTPFGRDTAFKARIIRKD